MLSRWTSRRPAGHTARSARSTNPTRLPSTRRERIPSMHRVNNPMLMSCYILCEMSCITKCSWTVHVLQVRGDMTESRAGMVVRPSPFSERRYAQLSSSGLSEVKYCTSSVVKSDPMIYCLFRLRLQRRLCWDLSVWSPTADPRECWPSRDASTLSWVVTRRER